MADLRTLAQAVVDAPDDDEARYALGDALGYPRDSRSSVPLAVAEAIIAVDAQGYARAMGEVDAMASRRVRTTSPGSDEHHALVSVADWPRSKRLRPSATKNAVISHTCEIVCTRALHSDSRVHIIRA